LIEQRLEQVMILSIDNGDPGETRREEFTKPQPAKSGTQDHNVRKLGLHHHGTVKESREMRNWLA
jgi:hypothetical protein